MAPVCVWDETLGLETTPSAAKGARNTPGSLLISLRWFLNIKVKLSLLKPAGFYYCFVLNTKISLWIRKNLSGTSLLVGRRKELIVKVVFVAEEWQNNFPAQGWAGGKQAGKVCP